MDYLNASLLNQYWGQIASGVNDFSSKMRSPGLVRPDVISLSVSGQSINATLPTPFGVIFNSGIFATAHGTTNGVDTQNYTINFATLFPSSGAVTGYVLAEYTQVFQNSEIITGPPPGFPSYNPAFVPSVGYTTNRDSLSLVASTGVANNITSFEIARCVLTAGASAITNLSTQYQVPAGLISTQNYLPLSANTVLSVSGTAGSVVSFVSSGVTLTLPPASASVGYAVPFVGNFSSGYSSFTTQGSDLIYGMGGTASGIGTVTVPPMAAGALWSNGFSWQFIENTSNFIPFSWPVSGAPLSPITYSASSGLSIPANAVVNGLLTGDGGAEFVAEIPGGQGEQLAVQGSVSGTLAQIRWTCPGYYNMYARVESNGTWGLVDSAYTTQIFTVDQSGNTTVLGNVTANASLYAGGTAGTGTTFTGILQRPDGNTLVLEANGGVNVTNIGGTANVSLSAAAGTAGNQVVNISQFPFDANTNGYMKLPNGWIIQWGQVQVTLSTNVTFPIAFPNSCLRVIVCEGAANSTTWGAGYPSVHGVGSVTTSYYTGWSLDWVSNGWSGSNALTQNWIAIGY